MSLAKILSSVAVIVRDVESKVVGVYPPRRAWIPLLFGLEDEVMEFMGLQ